MCKKVILVMLCLFSFSITAFADYNDQAYQIGQNIGNHWARIAAGGNDNKVFWYDNNDNFSKVKNIILLTMIHDRVSDPYLKQTYVDTLNKKFKDTGIKFLDFQTILDEYHSFVKQNSADSKMVNIFEYIDLKYQTSNYMEVNIYAYSNRPYPGIRTMGDCHVDFKLLDIRRYDPNNQSAIDVLFYNDQRLDAINASKGGLLDRITGRFKSKFNDALEGKPISE